MRAWVGGALVKSVWPSEPLHTCRLRTWQVLGEYAGTRPEGVKFVRSSSALLYPILYFLIPSTKQVQTPVDQMDVNKSCTSNTPNSAKNSVTCTQNERTKHAVRTDLGDSCGSKNIRVESGVEAKVVH